MRLFNRKDFLELPDGIIFAKAGKYFFHDFSVKEETLENDFLYIDLLSIDNQGSDDFFEKLDKMTIDNKLSIPMNDDCARDGCFVVDELFLVFEKEDLNNLMSYFKNYPIF